MKKDVISVDLNFSLLQHYNDVKHRYNDGTVWYYSVLEYSRKNENVRFYFRTEEDKVKFILKWC